jgi:hypothetical protein
MDSEFCKQIVLLQGDIGTGTGQPLAQGVDEQALTGAYVGGNDALVEGPAVQPGRRAAGQRNDSCRQAQGGVDAARW